MKRSGITALVVSLLLGAVPASAADIRPHLLVVFDTSGSMTEDPFGTPQNCDGSSGQPCNGSGTGSKMYVAKSAVSQVMAQNSSKIAFGFMRYFQDEGAGINASLAYGGKVINYDGQNNCAVGGQVLVPVGDNSYTSILGWMDNAESWPNDKELRADGATPLAGSLGAALDHFKTALIPGDLSRSCRGKFVLVITDGEETCGGNPTEAASALRAVNVGGTNYDVKTFVVGFGAGLAGSATLDAMARAGGTSVDDAGNPDPAGHALYASDQATLLSVLQVLVQNIIPAEVCDGLDNNCDGVTDENLTRLCGTDCGLGYEFCLNGQWVGCDAQQPSPEVCNGKDDNCRDGIDEGNPGGGGACTVSGLKGECTKGAFFCEGGGLVCKQTVFPAEEVCDGKDNDCDGLVDNIKVGGSTECAVGGQKGACAVGTLACQGGAAVCVQTVNPTTEVCDGIDNNCDGATDEGDPGGGKPCVVPGKKGMCAQGVTACENGAIICKQANEPKEEECNGRDDNCDGEIDEGDPGGGGECDTGLLGECRFGNLECRGGKLVCRRLNLPSAEVCDGKDNNCDGKTDEADPATGKRCATGDPGICAEGTMQCAAGAMVCVALRDPRVETCNYLDDDCDGVVDNGLQDLCGGCGPAVPEQCNGEDDDCNGDADDGAVCPEPEKTCINGECVVACQSGECPGGYVCRQNWCVGPCNGVKCEGGKTCQAGSCVDPCAAKQCPKDEVCVGGGCVPDDCYRHGCNWGKVCAAGECTEDPCALKTCAAGEFCAGGGCRGSCASVACPLDEICADGDCTSDPCALAECADGKTCSAGVCVDDPCAAVRCDVGRVCVAGKCTDDPCLAIVCPRGQKCKNGECVSVHEPGQIETDGGVSDGGGDGPADGGESDRGPEAGDGAGLDASDLSDTFDRSDAVSDAALGDAAGEDVAEALMFCCCSKGTGGELVGEDDECPKGQNKLPISQCPGGKDFPNEKCYATVSGGGGDASADVVDGGEGEPSETAEGGGGGCACASVGDRGQDSPEGLLVLLALIASGLVARGSRCLKKRAGSLLVAAICAGSLSAGCSAEVAVGDGDSGTKPPSADSGIAGRPDFAGCCCTGDAYRMIVTGDTCEPGEYRLQLPQCPGGKDYPNEFCGFGVPDGGHADGAHDGGGDAAADGALDAGKDAGRDAGADTGADAGEDTGNLSNTPPKAALVATPEEGDTNTLFQLDASGVSDAEDAVELLLVRWDWEDDGAWDTEYMDQKLAAHQFDTEGVHAIRVEVIDTGGLTDSATAQVLVGHANAPPKPDFTVTPAAGDTNVIFTLDASTSTDAEDLLVDLLVRWDFETDGTWDTAYEAQKVVQHRFLKEGKNRITLEAKDTGGLTARTAKEIDAAHANVAPVPAFTIAPPAGDTNTQFDFDASGSKDQEDDAAAVPLEKRWDFEGDGAWDTQFSTGNTAQHQYPVEGKYQVTLEVRDSVGESTTLAKPLVAGHVNTPPTAAFTVTPAEGLDDTIFFFSAAGVRDLEDPASALEVRWDFDGNGAWDTQFWTNKNATQKYSATGVYNAAVEVRDTGGLTAVTTRTVTVRRITGIRITPPDPTVTAQNGQAGVAQFTLLADYNDGSSAPVSGAVWSVDDPQIGGINASGLFASGTLGGGTTSVRASYKALLAATTVHVVFNSSTIAGGAPADSGAIFSARGAGSTPSRLPQIVYPDDGTYFPRNVAPIHFQWNAGTSNDLFHLVFSSQFTDIHVYTKQTSWLADDTTWSKIAFGNAGSEVTLSVYGTNEGDGADQAFKCGSDVRFRFSRSSVGGAIYYWNAGNGYIERLPVGSKSVEHFYQGGGRCVGCHAISHDGSKMAFTFDGGDGPLAEMRVSDQAFLINGDGSVRSNFQSYNPDGTRFLATFSYFGTITMRASGSGAVVATLPPSAIVKDTHPEWSYDGTRMTYARAQNRCSDLGQGCNVDARDFFINVVQTPGDSFGAETTLVGYQYGHNYYYPVFSPDDAVIAYNHSTDASPSNWHTYSNDTAELWVVDSNGARAPIRCDRANKVDNIRNSWPKFAPFLGDGLYWLAFSSVRAYGNIKGQGLAQIWVTAIEPAKYQAGQDPSYPSFWMPFQDAATNNHIPAWAKILQE
ncbi:MAG: PKD domain-containing protein [Deltaproteobacteria bacterium]|nr:PKD domain-containing protein [Deltaproteobacteria bacterium]